MIDTANLLTGIALIAAAAVLVLFARRSVERVENADAADQRSGGFQFWGPFQRWFGIGLLWVPIVLLVLVGTLVVLGSLGGELPGPPRPAGSS